jgi:hypothetical protein
MEDLYALLREDASELESQFRKASIQGKGTSQEVADFREHAIQDFVARFFPYPHRVTKGKVRDSFGAIADSVDCIVCNPNHPYTIDSHGKFTLLFAEGVDAAIEVKPDIGASAELIRGLEQGLSVKGLQRANAPTLMRIPWVVERSRRVPYVIFAMRCKASPIDTGKEIVEFYKSKGTPPVQQADFIVVNNVGIFANYLDASEYAWQTVEEPADKTGWFFEDWRGNSLAGFIWRLHMVAHASLKMDEDVLARYLAPRGGKTGIHGVHRIPT